MTLETAGELFVFHLARARPGLQVVAAAPRPQGPRLLSAWALGAYRRATAEGRN
jgi:hypothetical protein